MNHPQPRRRFLKVSLGTGLSIGAGLAGSHDVWGHQPLRQAQDKDASKLIQGKDKRLIVLKDEPAVMETPLSLINQSYLTPAELLFVRNNQQPKVMETIAGVDDDDWSVAVGDKTITVGQLKEMEQSSCDMVLQCSGSGRSLFSLASQTKGTQWGRGGMGCVKIAGVKFSDVLKKLGVEPNSADRYILANGKDKALPEKEDFLHTLPLDEVVNRSYLVLTLNDKPLPAIHGGPVRLVTPGVYGTMHVKWLASLSFQPEETSNYNHVPRYRVPKRPIKPGADYAFTLQNSNYNWNMKVKSVILSPDPLSTHSDESVKIEGVAFNDGSAPIETVLVSVNQGRSWRKAKLMKPDEKHAWTRFRISFKLEKGKHEIWSRAVDKFGRSQPLDGSVAWNPRGYEWNGVDKVEIERV